MTVNLTPESETVIGQLPGKDMTDAINRAIRVTAAVRRHIGADGCLTVLAADGTRVEIHIL